MATKGYKKNTPKGVVLKVASKQVKETWEKFKIVISKEWND